MISLVSRITDLIAPRLCMVCGQRLGAHEDTLCTVCSLHLPRTGYEADPYDNEMARIFWGRIPIERCGAWFFYKSGSAVSHLIYGIKYNDHPEAAQAMGKMVATEYAESGFFDGIDLIVPTPLSWRRRYQRGYNQSEEIAIGISRHTGIGIERRAVVRRYFHESQTHKQRWDRDENVSKAFALKRPERVAGRHLLLVDDVATTGATLCACAKALAQAGEVKVSILTLGYARQ